MDYASVATSERMHAAAGAAFSAPPSQASSTASSRSSSSCNRMNPRPAEVRSYSSSSPVSYHPNEPNRQANVPSIREASASSGRRTSPDTPPDSSSPSAVSTPASSVSSPSTLPSPPRWEPPPLSRESKGAEAGLPIRAPTGFQRQPDGHTDASVPTSWRMGVECEVPTTDNEDNMAVARDGPISSNPGVKPPDTTDRSSAGSSTDETDEESQDGETPPPPPPPPTSHSYLPLYSASPEPFPTPLPRLSPSSQEAALQQMGRTGRGGMATPLEHTHRYLYPLSGTANGSMSTPQHFPSPSSPLPTPGAAPLPPSFPSASLSWDARMGDGLSTSLPLGTSLGTTPDTSVVHEGGSSGPRRPSRVEVHPAAYSDRRRLLYHITQLATQYQRAQLQVEEQQAALVLLHAHFQSLQEHIQKTEKKRRSTSSSSSSTAVKSRKGENKRGGEPEDEEEEEEEEKDDRVHVEVHRGGLTAALLMAKNEAALQKQIRDRLPYFDPLLAQTQIHRLDDALAHVGLLREAELARAQQAEEVELPPLREECATLRKEVEVLQQQKTLWEQRCVVQEKQLQATTEEVERLRVEEVQLNHQLTVLQRFQNTIAGESIPAPRLSMREDPVRLMGLGVSPPSSSSISAAIWRLLVEESEARQSLWMDVFWEPIAMAFDAGLTWLLEMERRESDTQLAALQDAIREETAQRRAAYPAEVHHALRLQEEEEEEVEKVEERGPIRHVPPSVVSPLSHPLVSRDTSLQGVSTHGAEPHHKGSPIPHGSRPRSTFSGYDYITGADADLVVLKNQQAELRDIRLQLEKSKEHEHALTLEVSRWKSMYNNEKIQATQRSESHAKQLRRAFKEIVRDRQIVKASLEWKVEQQMRAAFSDGRLYEQKLRSSESQTVQD